MDEISPRLLFETAKRFDGQTTYRSPVVEQAADAVSKELNEGGIGRNVFALGSGTYLASHLKTLLPDFRGTVLQVSDVSTWFAQRAELYRLFYRFFERAGGRPAFLIGHSCCWSDRAIVRCFGGSDIRQIDVSPPGYRTVGRIVRLRYEADQFDCAEVRTGELQWLPGMPFDTSTLAKVVESRALARSSSHRESMGGATRIAEIDDPWLIRGLFPSLNGLSWAVETDAAKGVRIWRVGAPGEASPGRRLPSGTFDDAGVFDVYLLKAWRFFERLLFGSTSELRYHELCFAFSRDGRIAYLATGSHPVGSGWLRVDGSAMGAWVRKYAPPRNSR